jgi:PAS domain S-box-containing protein
MNKITYLLTNKNFISNIESFSRFAEISFNILDDTGSSLLMNVNKDLSEVVSINFSQLNPNIVNLQTIDNRTFAILPIEFEQHKFIYLYIYSSTLLSNEKLIHAAEFIANLTKQLIAQSAIPDTPLFKDNLFTIIEESPISIILTDKYGIVEYTNPYFSEFTGYSADEIKGKNINIIKSGFHDEAFYKDMWDTILSGNIWNGKITNVKKDGSKHTDSVRIIPVKEDGEIVRFIAIKSDITDFEQFMLLQEASNELLEATVKKRTDKLRTAYIQLKANRDLLTKAQRVARMGGWTRDLVNLKGYWTDEAYDIFGLERYATTSPSFEDIINIVHPEDREATQEWFDSFFVYSEPKEFHFRIIRPDGEERIISSIYSYELGDNGVPVRVNGIHHDRTEQTLYSKNIEKHQQLLKSILVSTGVGICVINSNEQIELVNPEFYSIFGKKSHNAVGLRLEDAFPELFISPDVEKFHEMLNSKQMFTRQNYTVTQFDQTDKKLILSISKTYSENDSITVITVSDVTELSKLHESQKEQTAMLLQQSKMAAMGEMIAAITHQWKQPLNAVGLLSQLIESEYKQATLTEEDLDEYIANIGEQIEFMLQTIKDFTDFFNPTLQKDKFEVRSALKEIIDLVSVLLTNYRVSVELELPDEEVFVYGSKNELKDAIVSNKRSEQGKIKVTCKIENKNIIIAVADNGGGIPGNVLENLFRSYFTTKGEKGTGIGLYIAKLIAETKLNGTISAHNEPDGAVFTLQIKSRD